MHTHRSIYLSIVAASLACAFAGTTPAAEPAKGPTRAEVKALVLQARANDTLMPAGEVPIPFAAFSPTRSRAEVKAEVMRARANDELIAAGERINGYEPASEPTQVANKARPGVITAARR